MNDRRPVSNPRRVPDNPLNLGGLDAAYRVAGMDIGLAERSELLTIALREHFSEREAKNKAKKSLTRIWLNPPPEAAPMIAWALHNPQEFPDRRLMHGGALIATYPFVGGIVAAVGQQAALNEVVTVSELRHRVEASWGATATVSAAVGKVITTLRRIGIVEGGGRTPVSRTTPLVASSLASTWLVHAIMLTRGAQAIDVHDALTAPEAFWVKELAPSPEYPLLERHTEGLHRRVWATP